MGVYSCLFVIGLNQKTLTFHEVPHKSKVGDFKQRISERCGIPKDELRLVYGGKQLEDNRSLQLDYDIKDNANFHVLLRLKGGQKDNIEFTFSECIVCSSGDCDQRVNMPCCASRHAICGECLVQLVRSTIEPSDSVPNYIIRCPLPSCRGEWNWSSVREVISQIGGLTDKEFKDLELKHADRLLHMGLGVKECRGCKSLCERKDPKNPRVNCQMCRKLNNGKPVPDFCWFCGHTWIGISENSPDVARTSQSTASTTQATRGWWFSSASAPVERSREETATTAKRSPCGNEDCTGKDFRLDIIKNCKTKDILDAKNVPSIRLCPNCGFIIEHREQCVHMSCPTCCTNFCMSCLKKNHSCSYRGKCRVAPRQEEIPILRPA